MRNISLFLNDIQNFMEDKSNKIIFLLILIVVIHGFSYYCLNKKAEATYSNITRSLEDINNIRIDIKNGKVERRF